MVAFKKKIYKMLILISEKYFNLVQRISFSTTGSETNPEGHVTIQTILWF